VHAGQVHYSYIPRPGELLFKNNWNLEASQTFLDRSLLKMTSLLKSLKEDDFLDLWLDIPGFPDYICSLIIK
jgi:hypothetical protein